MPTLTKPYRIVWRPDATVVIELRDWPDTEPTLTPLTTCAEFDTSAELDNCIIANGLDTTSMEALRS